MIIRYLAAILIAAISLPAWAGPVRTEVGLVNGIHEDGLTVYKGVPYAAPPLGPLRWRPPQSISPWKGVKTAEHFAPACMQSGVSMPGETPPKVSEDCLYLNIWVPPHAPRTHLPVMVWIHGGGYTNGSAAMPLYWGDRLAQKGVVVVTFGYRLGPFGFLALKDLAQETSHHSAGNYGLLDQIAALSWVKRNISSFGGDPARVTIFGQSAGGDCISILMVSPLAKNLFQRAIGQSGGLFEPRQLAPGYEIDAAEQDGAAYMKSLGVTSLAALRALPAADLLKRPFSAVSHPVIEPVVLPETPYEAFVRSRQNDVPLLVGSNEEEVRSLVEDLDATTAATYGTEIVKHWGELPQALYDAYPHATDAEARQARLDFERDLRFGWDMWTWARLAAAHSKNPVFYYHFAHKPPYPRNSIYGGWGASHFSELWYMFDHLNQEPWPWTPADRRVATDMSDYWVNFAKTGDPNGPGLPDWPGFRDTGQVLQIDDVTMAAPVAGLVSLARFDAVYAMIRGKPPSAP